MLTHINVLLASTHTPTKAFTAALPPHTTVAHLRDIISLCSGVNVDLAGRLKLELQSADDVSKSAGKGRRKNNNKKASNKGGFLLPLNNDSALVSDLHIDQDDAILVSNWNKIGSHKKYEIAGRLILLLSSPQASEQKLLKGIFESILTCQQDVNIDSGSPLAVLGMVDQSSEQILKLIEMLGFSIDSSSGEISVESKALSKNRRVQLFMEIFSEFQRVNSPLHTVEYSEPVSAPPSPASTASASPILVGHSAAVNIPNISASSGGHTVSRSLDNMEDFKEYEPVSAAASPRSSTNVRFNSSTNTRAERARASLPELELDEDWEADMFDDFVLSSPNSSSSRTPRRRDRRRRRRERVRVLLSQYQGVELGDGDQPSSLTYESLFDLENVPVGVEPGVLRLLPTQVLCEKDITIMKKNASSTCGGDHTCRICLGEYTVGETILRLPCLHFYHRGCITKWLSTNRKCPQDMIPVEL